MLDLVSYAAGLAEIALVVVIVYKVVQLRRRYRERAATGAGVYEALRESARAVLGRVAGGALAYEVAVFYYAAAGWRKSPPEDERSFTVYRESAYVPLIIGGMIAVVIETAAVHLLVRLWSPLAAWILTGLSVYAAIWLIGDFHAVRLRPVLVGDGRLELRLGLRWTASIPIESIRSVAAAPSDEARPDEYLKAVLLGAPNRRIELSEPVRADGAYGYTRRVRTIDLQIDDAARFDRTLRPD